MTSIAEAALAAVSIAEEHETPGAFMGALGFDGDDVGTVLGHVSGDVLSAYGEVGEEIRGTAARSDALASLSFVLFAVGALAERLRP